MSTSSSQPAARWMRRTHSALPAGWRRAASPPTVSAGGSRSADTAGTTHATRPRQTSIFTGTRSRAYATRGLMQSSSSALGGFASGASSSTPSTKPTRSSTSSSTPHTARPPTASCGSRMLPALSRASTAPRLRTAPASSDSTTSQPRHSTLLQGRSGRLRSGPSRPVWPPPVPVRARDSSHERTPARCSAGRSRG